MNKMVAMFPGQASQFVGMGKFWFENYESVRQRFAEASEILGFDLAALCFEGPAQKLNQTENTQVALLTSSVAIFEILKNELGVQPDYLAGHSIGELSALTAAGVFQFADGVRIARVRGEAMAACNAEGTASMSAVTKLNVDLIETVIQALDPAGESVQIANYNSPTQTVLSGTKKGLALVGEQLQSLGAKVIPLNVSGPFHSRFMGDAGHALADVLQSVELGTMSIPVMCGQEGRLYTREDDLKAALVNQLTSPVRWSKVLTYLSLQGVRKWTEVGPGSVLKNLTVQTLPAAEVYAYDQEADRKALHEQFASKDPSDSQVPNLIGLCLGAAVSTRNSNWDDSAYQKGVVEPYKEIKAIYDRVEQEKRSPRKEEMERSLSLLKTIFETKGTPAREQADRIQRMLRLTGTEALFSEHLPLVKEGR